MQDRESSRRSLEDVDVAATKLRSITVQCTAFQKSLLQDFKDFKISIQVIHLRK